MDPLAPVRSGFGVNRDCFTFPFPLLRTPRFRSTDHCILSFGTLNTIHAHAHSLRWTGQQGYLNATRVQWWADVPSSTPTSTSTTSTNERAPAGWVQKYGLLTEAVVAGAGHLAPMDQPARAFDMVVRFIEGKPWGKEEEGMEGMEEGGVEAPAVAVAAE